jgi:RNA polymerase sigma factor FliA
MGDDQTAAAPISSRAAVWGGLSARSRAGGTAAYRSEIDEALLIKRYVPTVKRLANHLKGRLPQTVQVEDLVQAGLIAVLRLARQSDCADIADALLRRSVVNAMIDEARRTAWAPTRAVRLARAAARAMQSVRQRYGREGSDDEIAAELGVTLGQYHQILVDSAGMSLLELDAIDDTAEPALHVAGAQEEQLRQNRMTAALATSIASLPTRERLVVSLYYEHELNMEEVGEVLGLDKSTISRSHGRALLMLKSALAEWSDPTEPLPRGAGD